MRRHERHVQAGGHGARGASLAPACVRLRAFLNTRGSAVKAQWQTRCPLARRDLWRGHRWTGPHVLPEGTTASGARPTARETRGCGERALRLRGPEQQKARFTSGSLGPRALAALLVRTSAEAAGKVQPPSPLGRSSGFWDGALMWLSVVLGFSRAAVLQESPQDRAAGFSQSRPRGKPRCFR